MVAAVAAAAAAAAAVLLLLLLQPPLPLPLPLLRSADRQNSPLRFPQLLPLLQRWLLQLRLLHHAASE